MIALIRYHYLTYLKSYRYIPPLALYLILLIITYTYTPNPILDSFYNTSIYLFFTFSWVTISFMHAENSKQERITRLHVRKKSVYFISKLISIVVMAVVLSAVSIIYPIVFDMFSSMPTVKEQLFGYFLHLVSCLTSMSVSLLFTRHMLRTGNLSWFGPVFVLVLTLAVAGVPYPYEGLQMFIYLLPPIAAIINFISEDSYVWVGFCWGIAYSAIVIGFYLSLVRNRDI
ncbi:ABC transporter permease [Priestia flexa]|uniref:ABC transporter permease n=1 Tax=Priestia flexa TaxID=86664 RepID=UPI001B327C48|nr:ABC transporter permease [Priestia flexa]